MAELSIEEVSRRTGGELVGGGRGTIRGVAPLETAGPGDLSFLSTARYLPRAESTRAAAVLVPRSLPVRLPEGVAGIVVDDPYAALVHVLPVLYPELPEPPGIHPTALLGEGSVVGDGVRIEPYAVVGRGARIGDRVRIGAHTVVGEGSVVGADTVLHPHVVLAPAVEVGERCVVHSGAQLGSGGSPAGGCRIGDDVEIGANTTVSRALVGETVLGEGSKLDNLVHVAPGVHTGKHVLIVAQVGISGGVRVEDGAVIGGQAGVVGEVVIGAGARVAGRSVVTADVPRGATVSGTPARPHREAMRAQAALFRLPELVEKVRRLERAVFGRKDEEPTSE